MVDPKEPLNMVMFPWLAMGHLTPFFHLTKCLAQKGHKVSFVSTPRNLQRLPKTPTSLSSLISLVSFQLPHVPNLPPHAECSLDLHFSKHQLLKVAYDLLEPQMRTFLESAKPDWIIYDFASHWLPNISAELGIRTAFFDLFPAAFLCFLGPPESLLNSGKFQTSLEDFTTVPEWIPFESNIAFRPYEMTKYVQRSSEYDWVPSDLIRLGTVIKESDVIAIRTRIEFEPEWFDLLGKLYEKALVPIGFLPMKVEDEVENEENWAYIKEWLDKQSLHSVVYVALGTEATLDEGEVNELALGLEQSRLPFFWVLRDTPESAKRAQDMLPNGFMERVQGQGIVYSEWAPQAKILSHNAIGGFLTHCGCNSFIEGLAFGHVLILFPLINDQGLNARLLQSKKLGVEIPRDEKHGSFTSDEVAESIRLAMVYESGAPIRDSVKKMKSLFGNLKENDQCVDDFISYLVEHKF